MDLDRHLHCLLWNPTLKLEAISLSSSSSSQIIRGTSWPIPVSSSLLEDEDNKNDEEDEADNEDGEAGDGVLAL